MSENAAAAGSLDQTLTQLLARIVGRDQGVLTAAVLIPDQPDAKGTAYTAEEIRKAMDYFLAGEQQIGFEHQGQPVAAENARHLYSRQLETDEQFGDQHLPAGTWIMAVLLRDESLWDAVERGEITGLSIQGTAVATEIAEGLLAEAKRRLYSYVQLPIDYPLSLRVLALAKTLIDPEDLLPPSKDNPLETEPHITVLYGVHGEPIETLQDFCRGTEPFLLVLGRVSHFEKPDCDVVKLDVHSASLERLHQTLRAALPNTQTHPEYRPHVTLGYVKKGAGAKYDGRADLEGVEFWASYLLVTDKQDRQHWCSLMPNYTLFAQVAPAY